MSKPPAGPGFRVLVVCTANLCRSPLAEHLLRARTTSLGLTWAVSSAGVQARPGQPMHPSSERVLRSRSIDASGWVSTRVEPAALATADLVVTATQQQRDQLVTLRPAAMSRTFTLLQLARWAEAIRTGDPMDPADFGPWLARSARSARSHTQPSPPDQRDLADPYGHTHRHFVRCASLIDQAWTTILGSAPLAGGGVPAFG